MYSYDEAQGLAFQLDVQRAYAEAGQLLDTSNVVWSNRMTWDATTMGYPASRPKHLNELRVALGLPPISTPESPFHVGPGPLTEGRAHGVVNATSQEFPQLFQVFDSDAVALEACDEFVLRTIWHLQHAGFASARQKNPSGVISADKVCIKIDGKWQAYDIATIGSAGRATVVQFQPIGGANPVASSGISDGVA